MNKCADLIDFYTTILDHSIEENDTLLDAGVDSLKFIILDMETQTEFGCRLNSSGLNLNSKFSELLAYVAREGRHDIVV
jgi:acyl carrier protein